MPKLTGTFVILGLLLLGCQTPGPVPTGFEDQNLLGKIASPPHHWGQPGQSKPNHGWSDYGYLRIDAGGEDYIVVNQAHGEWLAETYAKRTGQISVRALSLQGIGVFYSPKDQASCERYDIEKLGLWVETWLFFLSEAFPSGPDAISGSQSSRASGAQAELRFLQGELRLKSPWSIEAQVRTDGAGRYRAEIRHDKKSTPVSLVWEKQAMKTVDSKEKIGDWQPCWLGVKSWGKDGNVKDFKPSIGDTSNLNTFGDIRQRSR